MKKILMFLGGVFLVLIVVIVILAIKANALDKESKQYVDTVIPAITSDWNIKEVEDRASPEFKAAVNNEDLNKLFGMFRKLGKLKEYKGCKGDSNISLTTGQGKVITAAYVVNADFDTGPAEIYISLIKHGDLWQILGLRINSKVFFEQL